MSDGKLKVIFKAIELTEWINFKAITEKPCLEERCLGLLLFNLTKAIKPELSQMPIDSEWIGSCPVLQGMRWRLGHFLIKTIREFYPSCIISRARETSCVPLNPEILFLVRTDGSFSSIIRGDLIEGKLILKSQTFIYTQAPDEAMYTLTLESKHFNHFGYGWNSSTFYFWKCQTWTI